MIPFQVNRVPSLAIVALALGCAPANSTKQAAESTRAVRTDTSSVASTAAAPSDSDGVRADLARIQGSPTAPVWVIEVSDFQCPFCKEWHDQTYQKLRDEFVKTGKVRLAYINFPLAQHRNAWPPPNRRCAPARRESSGRCTMLCSSIRRNGRTWHRQLHISMGSPERLGSISRAGKSACNPER